MKESIEVTLSDGRVAKLRPPKGRDLIRAQDLAGADNKIKYTCALLAQITTVGGKPILMEDVIDFYAADIDKLAMAAGAGFLSSTDESLPDSSSGVSHLPN